MTNPAETLANLRAAAESATSPGQRAEALNQLAAELEKQSQYAESLAAAEEAQTLAKQAGEVATEAEALQVQGVVHARRGEYSEALRLFVQVLELHEELGDRSGVARVTGYIGIVYSSLSDYARALEYYTRAIELFEYLGERSGVATGTANIGSVYSSLSDYPQALEYYTRAIALFEELGNHIGVANAVGGIGNVYYRLSDYPRALEYFTRALELLEELGDRLGVAHVTINTGLVYDRLSDHPRALEYYTRAIALHEELGDRSGVAHGTCSIGTLYANKNFAGYNPTKAEEFLRQAITLNQELGTQQQLYQAHEALADLYAQENRWEEALQHYKKFHELYQEVHTEEVRKKAIQVEQQRQIAEMEKRTAAERADAEATKRVLHNILPPTIAQRVVKGEEHIAESFESVTVLFADIVGFTVLSQHISAQELVASLDLLFSRFDELAERHGLEKIKTIGDAYMAVSGLPERREDHAESAARMAMEMIDVVEEFGAFGSGGARLQVRIGLHTGEVVAGIIGKKKFAYDLWGDAVNTAARMESHGEAGKIHVSKEFAQALLGMSNVECRMSSVECRIENGELRMEDGENEGVEVDSVSFPITDYQLPITLQPRGVLNIKGKGEMQTYFLSGATQ